MKQVLDGQKIDQLQKLIVNDLRQLSVQVYGIRKHVEETKSRKELLEGAYANFEADLLQAECLIDEAHDLLLPYQNGA